MRRCYLGLGILALTLAVCVLALWQLGLRTERTAQSLQGAYDAACQGDVQQAGVLARQAHRQWQEDEPFYGSVLNHADTDEVAQQFSRLLGSLRAGDIDDFQAACCELITMVRHLSRKEKPLYYNLL